MEETFINGFLKAVTCRFNDFLDSGIAKNEKNHLVHGIKLFTNTTQIAATQLGLDN